MEHSEAHKAEFLETEVFTSPTDATSRSLSLPNETEGNCTIDTVSPVPCHSHRPLAGALDLPMELVDEILDGLNRDRATLKSLALVCRSFRPIAQKRLHSYVFLRCNDMLLQRAADVYASSVLQAYVQALSISLFTRYQDELDALAAVVPMFRSAKSLQLHSGGLPVRESFNVMSQYCAFLGGFCDVEDLRLHNFRPNRPLELYHLLQCFPRLSALDIRQLSFSARGHDEFSVVPSDKVILPRLQSLHVRTSLSPAEKLAFFSWLACVIGPQGCTDLVLSPSQLSDVDVLLRRCGSSLLQLEVILRPSSRDNSLMLLEHNTSLASIKLRLTAHEDLPCITRSLSTLPRPSLRELIFVCDCLPPSEPSSPSIASLISTLNEPLFHRIRTLRIVFSFSPSLAGSRVAEAIAQNPEEKLARFAAYFQEHILPTWAVEARYEPRIFSVK